MFLIVGLGNPGQQYENTRHNTGRIVAETFRKKNKFSDWQENKNAQALYSADKVGKEKVELILPENFMNKSGKSVSYIASQQKINAENVIVIYDDLDLSLGKVKISFNKGSGGHKGLESIERSLRTKKFIRLRVGISRALKNGKVKKPQGQKEVVDFILGKFKKAEMEEIKKISKKAVSALEEIIISGLAKAMGDYN
jgi:peptidyl-tRNA hydrolase, PTH1 family